MYTVNKALCPFGLKLVRVTKIIKMTGNQEYASMAGFINIKKEKMLREKYDHYYKLAENKKTRLLDKVLR